MIGETISHYKIIEKLGEGGMGVVYKAEDTKLERLVALKFLPPELTQSNEWKQRFLREAQAVAALAHPNICTIHEIDETERQAFIAMECIDGRSLTEKIEAGPLDVREAVNIALRVAEGLKHAHARGIVHRDIKPANIMVTADCQVKITDFGLAKLSGKTRLTKTATIMGTVAYMSPEQARGEAVDHRTDIWSLGVLLYEMLTGARPFEAETDTGLIYKIINDTPEPISNRRGDIPVSLISIIEKAMQKDPQIRYQNAKEFIDDLETAKTGAMSMQKQSPSIAVLSFVNMSADPEQEYFCDGLAEEIINALTQIEDLHVVARTSAFFFKGKDVKIRDIGKELNVETVLEGSVRRAGNRVRITAQLVKVDDGYHLWSEKYDRNMDDIFAIQDEISEAIVSNLRPTLLGSEKARLAKRQTVPIKTYDLCLKGRYFLNKSTGVALKKAIDYFEQALAIAPNNAQAYAGLADAHLALPIYSSSCPQETYQKGRRAAVRALEIDDTLAEAHTSMGFVKYAYDWDWKGAEKEFKQAIELNPGYALAHMNYAEQLRAMNRFDEAIAEMEKAQKLDPLSLEINRELGSILIWAGQFDRAIEVLRKTIEIDPNHPYTHLLLGQAYSSNSMNDETLREFEREKEVLGVWNAAVETSIAVWHARVGERDKALDMLNTFLTRSKTEYVPPSLIGMLYFVLEDIDRGFEWLDKACDVGDVWLLFIQGGPGTALLRSDPRFGAILRKMGLEP